MFDALAQSAWISRIGWVLIHTLWQFAVVAAAALILQRIFQRRSAAVQYCVLLAAMAAIVAAPVVTCFLVSPTEPPPVIAKAAVPANSQKSPTVGQASGSMPIATQPAASPPLPTPNPQPLAAADAADPSVTSSWWARQADRIRPWLPEIVLLWFAGVFLASMRPLVSWRTMRRLRRTGVSAAGEAIEIAVARIAQRLKIARTVEVLQSALVQTPIVLGYFRPVILLPVCVLTGLSPLQLESILAHELAHIRRHDYLVNLLQTLVETLFFYHPAVWWLSRQIRNERENCCDDVAMSLSASRAEYGRALLAIEELRAAPTALSLAARGGSLLSRIRRIAGHDVAPSFAATGSILGAVLAPLVIFAAVTWGSSATAEKPKISRAPIAQDSGKTKAPSPLLPGEETAKKQDVKTVHGKVLDDAGNPIAGADVWLPILQTGVAEQRPVIHSKTDLQGRVSLEIPAAWFREIPTFRITAVVWAYAPGRCINTASAYKPLFKDDKSELEIKLGPESDLSFIVQSPDGKPVAGAAVSPYHVETEVAFMIVPDELLPLVGAKTDANGLAALPAIPRSKLSNVKIDAPEFGARTVRLNPSETGAKTIELRPPGRIEGRFIAAEPSQVSHVMLFLTTRDYSQTSDVSRDQEGMALVVTDDQGRFVVPKIATGDLSIDTAVEEKHSVQPELPKDARVNADKTTPINIPMIPTVTVHGRVCVKGTKQPVPNAWIHLYYGGYHQGANPITAANGEYTARVLPGDVRQQVIYMPPEFVAVNVDMNKVIQVPADADNFELPPIEAERAKTISGQLSAADALKFTDFYVCVIDGKKYYGNGTSDEKGSFSVGQIPESVDPLKVRYGLVRKRGSTMPEFIGGVTQTDPLVIRVQKAEEPATAPKLKRPSPPPQSIDVSGQVLDDETGKPVGQFVVQAGLVDKKDPTKITWGYSETRTTSPNAEGTFSQRIDWGAGWRARIIAAGYLPQPIFDKGVPPTATKIEHYIVRLKRGKQVAGRVLYHDGKPAADAAVFMIVKEGGGGVQIGDGKAWQSFGPERSEDPTVTRATTDADGRFELPGGGRSAKAIAVSAPNVDLWVVPPPKPDATDELTIKLPEPGRLVVKYDIDGSPAKAPFSLQMVTWETPPLDPSWKGIDNIHELTVPNKGELTIDHLPPGKYTLARIMPAEANHSVGRFFDDRREITVRSGKTATTEYIRYRGTPVEGQITGLKEGMLAGIYPGAIVAVRPTAVTGPLESGASMEEPIFDIIVCGPDGKFKTPRLLPGEYAVIAEAFEAEKPENQSMSGIRQPAFLGRTTVTVPESGPPPTVTIEIRRRDEAPPTPPAQ